MASKSSASPKSKTKKNTSKVKSISSTPMKQIKSLLQNPTKATLVLDVSAVAKHLKLEKDVVLSVYREISENSSRVALNFVAQPFISLFGEFARHHCSMMSHRWPTTAEASKVFALMYKDVFSEKFMEKRTKAYTIRKLIGATSQWDTALQGRKGVLPQAHAVADYGLVLREFKKYLKNLREGKIELSMSHSEDDNSVEDNSVEYNSVEDNSVRQETETSSVEETSCEDLHTFANFVLQEVGFLNHAVRDELSKTLVTLYATSPREKTA